MNFRKDVCIIGGGVIGLSVAYYLSKAGKKVILLEKKEIGAGASGSCDECIFLQSKKPGIALELAMESVELYKTLGEELQWDIAFKNEGGTVLIEDERQLKIMEGQVAKQRAIGLEVEIIDRKELKKHQPMVSDHIIASTYCAQDGQVDPFHLMRGYIRNIVKNEGEILRGCEPAEVDLKDGTWTVKTSAGDTIEAETVVLSAGAWTPEAAKLVGLEVPISPRRGQLLITEPIPKIGPVCLTAGYIASKLDKSLMPDKGPYAKEIGLGFSLSQTCEGNCMIGSTREDAGFNKSTFVRSLSTIMMQARDYFPVLGTVNIIRTISGFRPACADGSPIIGEVDGLPGFFIAAGHEGDGIALSPITGLKVADMIMGKTDPRFDELNFRRFQK